MFDALLMLLLALLGIPVYMFALECLLGLLPSKSKTIPNVADTLTTAYIVPAHNEALVIADTLRALSEQMSPQDQVFVVADNCNDATADIVRKHGHTALERSNDIERGKGYALEHGMQHLKAQDKQPDIVMIIDADCLLAPGALAHLKQQVQDTRHPAQACYLMKSGNVDRIAVKVSEFAFMVKNQVRLQGASRMGMPVPLTGTGMAFPWQAIADAHLATGDIVEDMRLGVELAEQGLGAKYCPEALVYSYFPQSEEAERTQRERWEHGHLSTLKSYTPRLLKRAAKGPSLSALAMALDLFIPPLSLLVMMIGTVFAGTIALGILLSLWHYASIAGGYLTLLGVVITLTWLRHGTQILTLKQLLHIPVYMVSKIAIYIGYIVRKQTKWIRTDRH